MTLGLLLCLIAGCDTAPEPAPTPPAPDPQVPAAQAPAAPVPDTIALRHILISWDGMRLGNKEPRTQAEALTLVNTLHGRLQAGEDFKALASEHSDDKGSAARQGWLGPGQRDTWVPEFSAVAFTLQVGEFSAPTQTPFGYHIIQREAMDEVHLQQILVQHAEVPKLWKTDKEESKSREEAQAQVQAALAALESGQDFGQVAKQYSDGPMGPYGGDLGLFLEGELGPAIDQQASQLEPGARSGIFETTAGFHILRRSP